MKLALRTSLCCLALLFSLDLQGGACPTAFDGSPDEQGQGQGQGQGHELAPRPGPRIYFLMTRLFADGTLADITANIPHMASLGIRELWISPVHEQTTMFANGEPNNHMYWPKDPASVAAMIGGWPAFHKLVATAREYGIHICLDVVLDQAGFGGRHLMRYEENGHLVEKWIDAGDPAYFRQAQLHPTIYDRLDDAKEPAVIETTLAELATQQWHPYLPVYNHFNPEIYAWLFYSYKQFADAGIRVMRLDAYKHIPLEFTSRFMREMSQYVWQRYGERMTYLIEHVTGTYEQLQFLNERAVAETKGADPIILFLDFPKAFELEKLSGDLSYGLHEFRTFIENREHPRNRLPLEKFVGDITNHDFFAPIPDAFNHQLAIALSDFFSHIPSIIYHGDEETGKRQAMRAPIDNINPLGEAGLLSKKLNDVLDRYRSGAEFSQTKWHASEADILIAEKRVGDKTLILATSRQSAAFPFQIHLDQMIQANSITTIHRLGGEGPKVLQVGPQSLEIQFDGQTLLIFEVQLTDSEL